MSAAPSLSTADFDAPLESRVDPDSGETDYAARAADGVNVKRSRPDMHYVLVEKTAFELARYRALGYAKVPRTADGPYIFADDDEDAVGSSHIEYMGHVLMALPLAKYKHIQKHGHPSGANGLAMYDEIERQIVREGGVDLMRGKMGRGLHMIPETSALVREQ